MLPFAGGRRADPAGVVVVECIIILIIIIVDPFETAPAHFCHTVHLESPLFLNLHFYIVK